MSDVPVVLLGICSNYACNTWANRLKHGGDEVVWHVNEFTRARVENAECLSVVTDAGTFRTRDSNRKSNKITRMDVQPNIYMPAKVPAKCPGKPTAQFKPITSDSKIKSVYPSTPLGCNVQLSGCSPYATSCIAPKYWDLPQLLPPSWNATRIY